MKSGAPDTYVRLSNPTKTYRVVRLRLQGYSMSIPERTPDGGYRCRKLHYEVMDLGGKNYRCAKDHQDRVVYIDTQTMEEAVESSG